MGVRRAVQWFDAILRDGGMHRGIIRTRMAVDRRQSGRGRGRGEKGGKRHRAT